MPCGDRCLDYSHRSVHRGIYEPEVYFDHTAVSIYGISSRQAAKQDNGEPTATVEVILAISSDVMFPRPVARRHGLHGFAIVIVIVIQMHMGRSGVTGVTGVPE